MIRVYPDLKALSQAAAEIFAELADQSIARHGRFWAALSGGRTPELTYTLLCATPFWERIRWQAVHIFWGDERCVPADDPRSNTLMVRKALLEHVPVPPAQIHPIACDLPPKEAAEKYETELHDFFCEQAPSFDLVLLGLGANAHTASLFPHSPVLDEKARWVSEVNIPELDTVRITLTAPIINQAEQVVFLVSGADKAPALRAVLEGRYQPQEYPAQLIRPVRSPPIWLVDQAAAQKLAVER
jgi:6-phosphogluconolactonase